MGATVAAVVGVGVAAAAAAVSAGVQADQAGKAHKASIQAQMAANANVAEQQNEQLAAAMMGSLMESDPANFFAGADGMDMMNIMMDMMGGESEGGECGPFGGLPMA